MGKTKRTKAAEYYASLPSPCFVITEKKVRENCEILATLHAKTGCRVLLALKAFVCTEIFPMMRKYLQGACASGPYEARLAREEFGGEVHVTAPAYSIADIDAILPIADYIVFNTPEMWQRMKPRLQQSGRHIACGIRLNPEYAEVETDKYNPCMRYSRLGTTQKELDVSKLDGITGAHFHALCEQNTDALENVLKAVDEKFGDLLHNFSWLNVGGGHHITRKEYDKEKLCRLIDDLRSRYALSKIYIEPGEAHVLDAGVLVATVLDVMRNEKNIAVLDTSATAHMPDVIDMPYRPHIIGSALPGECAHTYRLGGVTCLAGDVIGEYSFPNPLAPGDRLVFTDMAHYTVVKTTMFNGIHHPAVAIERESGAFKVVKKYDYHDYLSRLP